MATGDHHDFDENDDDSNLTVPEPESNAQTFVTNFMATVAQIDIDRNQNVPVASNIIEKVATVQDPNCHHLVSDLKRIADDIDARYGDTLNDLVTEALQKQIICNVENGYKYFKNIANSIFENGVTLGRIFVLVMFGYRWIVRSLADLSGSLDPITTIIKYLVKFLSSGYIQAFIASMGGWKAVMHSLSAQATLIFAALAGVFVFLALYFHK